MRHAQCQGILVRIKRFGNHGSDHGKELSKMINKKGIMKLQQSNKTEQLRQSSNQDVNLLRSLGSGTVSLQLDKHNNIGYITINNIETRNAMSGKMMVEFLFVIDELSRLARDHSNELAVVILRLSNGLIFSGTDLSSIPISKVGDVTDVDLVSLEKGYSTGDDENIIW